MPPSGSAAVAQGLELFGQHPGHPQRGMTGPHGRGTVAGMVISRPVRSLSASVVLLLALAPALAGCSEDSEELCSAVDDLQASVADVTEVEVGTGAMTTLQGNLEQVQTDLGAVKDEAADEYAEELDLVEKAAASAALAIDLAITSPSAAAAADVVPAVQLLGSRLVDLTDAVEGTC